MVAWHIHPFSLVSTHTYTHTLGHSYAVHNRNHGKRNNADTQNTEWQKPRRAERETNLQRDNNYIFHRNIQTSCPPIDIWHKWICNGTPAGSPVCVPCPVWITTFCCVKNLPIFLLKNSPRDVSDWTVWTSVTVLRIPFERMNVSEVGATIRRTFDNRETFYRKIELSPSFTLTSSVHFPSSATTSSNRPTMKHKTLLGHSMIIIIFIHIECHVRDCVDYPLALPLSLSTQHRIAHDIQTNEWRPNCPIFFSRRKLCTMHRTCANPYTNSNSIDIDMKRKHRRKHNQSGPHIWCAVLCLVWCDDADVDGHSHSCQNHESSGISDASHYYTLLAEFQMPTLFQFQFPCVRKLSIDAVPHLRHTHTQHTTQTPCHANSVCGRWTCGSVCVWTHLI